MKFIILFKVLILQFFLSLINFNISLLTLFIFNKEVDLMTIATPIFPSLKKGITTNINKFSKFFLN